MTAPETQPTGMTVAVREDGIGTLPSEYRQALTLRKQLNVATAELANLNWGKGLDQQTRRAIADFCQTFNVDAATEIYVLGGNIYINGKFYLRKLAEMVEAGKIVYAFKDMIHVDARLTAMAAEGNEWAAAENVRRQQERIIHDVDDSAVSACVFRVKPTGVEREFTGVKAVYADAKDPVGNAFPTETVETRAARRALRQLASHVPAESRNLQAIEAAAAQLSARVESFRERQKKIEALPSHTHPSPLAAPDGQPSRPANYEVRDGRTHVLAETVDLPDTAERTNGQGTARPDPTRIPEAAFAPLLSDAENAELDARLALEEGA